MRYLKHISDTISGLLFHAALYLALAMLTAAGILVTHPATVALVLGALGLLILLLWFRIRAAGKRYPEGEIEAIPDLKKDLRALGPGDSVTVCGSGATSIVYLVPEVYHCLVRGVQFEVYVLHPQESIAGELHNIELDLREKVARKMARQLRRDRTVRMMLDPQWCDDMAKKLEEDNSPELHRTVIRVSADIWARIQDRACANNPAGSPCGQVRIRAYNLIPFLKCWRFVQRGAAATREWYYIADHIFHPGVGIDNPMVRFRRTGSADNESKARRLIGYIEQLDPHSRPL